MKVVINKCYGGFGLSPKATKMFTELNGKKCYFFKSTYIGKKPEYKQITMKEAEKGIMWFAFSVPNPWDYLPSEHRDPDGTFTSYNATCDKIKIEGAYDILRNDKNLVQVVEKLGKKANGHFSNLKVVEIPDGTEWEIDDYDGQETINEKHQSWR
jgi:hypothetical protein